MCCCSSFRMAGVLTAFSAKMANPAPDFSLSTAPF